ncbi:MBL fold metallo-hydrolase [Georgenia sp. AZ-5]|uniref:MBL fold metallo-hydrolase n=1 Tax=Georgenia sp. AZ-5 TaxID=3367526 RepID=UPI00375467DE
MTTTVTLTGTGTPRPAPGRAGAGVLVQHHDESIQIDAGRATAMRLAEAGLACNRLDALFLTHHHSDHVIGVPDLLISRWVMGATEPLVVVAPDGPLTEFGGHVLDLWAEDLRIRQEHTGRAPMPAPAWRAFDATGRPTVVWEGRKVRVSSVLVQHQPVEPAVAYRVDTDAGTSVVVSGDTRVCDGVSQLAHGADVLVHEVVRPALLGKQRGYIGEYHAEAVALGALAAEARVARLVLTHLEPAPTTPEDEAAFEKDVREGGFTGEVVVGQDLSRVVIQ